MVRQLNRNRQDGRTDNFSDIELQTWLSFSGHGVIAEGAPGTEDHDMTYVTSGDDMS